MTFKHVKFGDSVTMRSLEKVAQEKGWIKNDPIYKTASLGPDLNPSINFMENVIKLCSGLRHSGFDKYADELEATFIVYKQADKSYDVSNEKGEDLIDAAHPDGGHQMEGVEGDAFVETILEKHLKMLDVTNKEPKAKLSNAKDILSVVRVVLAQDSNSLIAAKVTEAKKHAENVLTLIKNSTTPDEAGAVQFGRITAIAPLMRSLTATPLNLAAAQQSLTSARTNLQYVDPKERADGKHTVSMSNYTAWNQMVTDFDAIGSLLGDITKLQKGDVDLINQMSKLLTTLNSYRSLLNDEGFTAQDRADGNKEINTYVATLNNWKKVFAGLDPEEKAAESARYQAKLTELAGRVKQLYQEITAP